MSIVADNIEHELTIEEIALMILHELRIANLRQEEAFETGIEEDDIE